MADRPPQSGPEPQAPRDPPRARPGLRSLAWVLLAGAVLAIVSPRIFGFGRPQYPSLPYSRFRAELETGNVPAVELRGDRIRGRFADPITVTTAEGDTSGPRQRFETFVPAFGDDSLLGQLEAHDVVVRTEPASGSSGWDLLLTIGLPILVLVGFWYLMGRQLQARGQGLLSIGQSRARLYRRLTERTTFDDVAGAEGAKQELREVVEFLKHPERFEALGGTVPKGVLLVGPPGTGKTLLARAVAGEADAPFFSISGSDFMEMFVGVGASRVRDLFRTAKASVPSIIFIDELDSIGRHRGAGLGGGHDEREQTLNQLLSELDGFEPAQNIVVMAATNRPDVLDPALLRPGRFDRRVVVDLPTTAERRAILRLHARRKPLDPAVDLGRVAQGTPGFAGADLENLLNEAALLAARRERTAIHPEDIEEARDKVLMGLKRTGLALTEEELGLLAHHEAGHAVVAAALPNADPVHKVTIVPRGRAMGVTQQIPEGERYVYSREYLVDRITVMLGGRAGVELAFGTATSGAENDLRQATHAARRMIVDWGMSERLGPMAVGHQHEEVFLGQQITERRTYSETTARTVDEDVQQLLGDCIARARQILREHEEAFRQIAALLLTHEEIPGEQVTRIVRGTENGTPRLPRGGTINRPASAGSAAAAGRPEGAPRDRSRR